MYDHSEKSAKFAASKSYPFTRVGKLKAIVDPFDLFVVFLAILLWGCIYKQMQVNRGNNASAL